MDGFLSIGQQNLKNECLPVPIGTTIGAASIHSNSAPSHLFVLYSVNYMSMCCTEDIFKTKRIINKIIVQLEKNKAYWKNDDSFSRFWHKILKL
jgi:hypothetical protein